MDALGAEAFWRHSGETCVGVSREGACTEVLAAGAVVASERLSCRPFQMQE